MTRAQEDQFLSSLGVPCDGCGKVMCRGFCAGWYDQASSEERMWAYKFGLTNVVELKMSNGRSCKITHLPGPPLWRQVYTAVRNLFVRTPRDYC